MDSISYLKLEHNVNECEFQGFNFSAFRQTENRLNFKMYKIHTKTFSHKFKTTEPAKIL